jgi:hypothetical protein
MSTAKGADSWETGYFAAGTSVWQRKEAGHYSGLITRTGRHPNISSECGAQANTLQHTPNTIFHRQQRRHSSTILISGLSPLLVTCGKTDKIEGLTTSQRRRNFATASVRVRTCNFS